MSADASLAKKPAFNEPTVPPTFSPSANAEQTSTPSEETMKYFTEEDVVNARQQEKNKLYPEIERLRESVALLQKEREERLAAEEAARKAAEEEARQKAEAEMDLAQRLELTKAQFEERLAQIEAEREQERAILERERQFATLQAYRIQRIDEERDNILPELIDLVDGSTEEEIEASIAGLKERSARILDMVSQQSSTVEQHITPGTRVTSPAAGPLDANTGKKSYTPEEIRAMSYEEYQKVRSQLIGRASETNRGLFG